MKKYVIGFLVFTAVFGFGAFKASAESMSISQLINLFITLGIISPDKADAARAAVAGTNTASSGDFCYSWNSNLKIGDGGLDVDALQQALDKNGVLDSSKDGFTEEVAAAVVKFQGKYYIPQTGYVGPLTRARLNSMYGCSSNIGVDTTTTVTTPTTVINTSAPTSAYTSIAVTYPQSGYSLDASGTKGNGNSPIATIQWNQQNGDFPVSIYLMNQNNQYFKTIAVNIPDTGSYVWPFDSTLPNGTYQIKVDVLYPSGKSGQNSAYSGYFTIGNSPASQTTITTPTCSLSSNKSLYTLGETITYSWTSQNATYASFQQDTSDKDHLLLPGDKLSANGSQQVTANVTGNPPATLIVGGVNNGTGSCSKTVNVTSKLLETVSFDQNTLRVMPGTAFTLSGGTSAKSGLFTVAIVGPNYSGSTDWNIVGNILKSSMSYIAVSKTISLYGSGWSSSFGGIGTEGYYTVFIYDSNYNFLGTATLWVTFKG